MLLAGIFFSAIGSGKTKIWYTIMDAIANPKQKDEMKIERKAAFKQHQVVAYIQKFWDGCEFPPGKGLQGLTIDSLILDSNINIFSRG
jgi:hypothetical protein